MQCQDKGKLDRREREAVLHTLSVELKRLNDETQRLLDCARGDGRQSVLLPI